MAAVGAPGAPGPLSLELLEEPPRGAETHGAVRRQLHPPDCVF